MLLLTVLFSLCPREGQLGATVFPYSKLEEYRNKWPIAIPQIDLKDENAIKMLYSMSRGPFPLKKAFGYLGVHEKST